MKKNQERESANSSQFPKMGEEIPHALINMSGKPSSHTTSVPRKTMGRGSSPIGKSAIRGRSMIHEANGPACHITTALYRQNSSEASSVMRNTKLLPAVTERPDHVGSAITFWDKRKFGQKVQ